MPQPEHYECLVLGSGNGGMFLAWQMARSGRRTAVVERRWIGGSCPNINCLPSKNEIWSAKVADLARHGQRFGAPIFSSVSDMTEVRGRKRQMVEDMIAGTLEEYKSAAPN
jgi:pyruvate/2-oxoglutarate dehydrogenase complex dihydrolipoamide dehydrogenase (E3) component